MSPPKEFYIKHAEAIGDRGIKVEQADPRLLTWVDAQTDKYPHIFLTEVRFMKAQLYGWMSVSRFRVGEGKLEFPVSLDGTRLDFPVLPWVVDVNRRATGNHDSAVDMFRAIGLEFRQWYGDCNTSTSSGDICGVNFALDIHSEPHNKSEKEFPRKFPKENSAWFALSAMGIADDIERTLAEKNIRITPISALHLMSPNAPTR